MSNESTNKKGIIKTSYSELETSGFGFWGIFAFFGLLVMFGIGAFNYIHHHGHYVTGMNNQIVWGIPHVFAIFLIVAASGAANIATIGTVFGKTKLSTFWTFIFVTGCLFIDRWIDRFTT